MARLDELLPRDDRWRHSHGSRGHGADHVLPLLVPPSITVPVVGGQLQLGTWQSIALLDPNADNSHSTRGVVVSARLTGRRVVASRAMKNHDLLPASVMVSLAFVLIACGSAPVPPTAHPTASPAPSTTPATATPPATGVLPSAPPPTATASPTAAQPTATATPAATIVGQLSVIAGGVTMAGADGVSLHVTGTLPVASGTTFTVDPAGLAQLVDEQGSTVRFGPETSVVLDTAPDGSLSVAVQGSKLWLVSPEGSTVAVHIDLDGTAVEAIGANLLAGCDGSDCFVGVLDGTATVSAGTGNPVDLSAFQQVGIAGGSITAPGSLPPSAITADEFANQNSLLDQQQGLRGTPDSPSRAALDGDYTVTYKTIASDRDPVTDDTVQRTAHVTTTCEQLVCAVTLSVEVKGANGETITLDTPLSFDGTSYHGQLTRSDPCHQRQTFDTKDGANQDYTGDVEVVVDQASVVDGLYRANGFSSTNIDTTTVNDVGRAFGCSVNPNNDGFSTTSTTTAPRRALNPAGGVSGRKLSTIRPHPPHIGTKLTPVNRQVRRPVARSTDILGRNREDPAHMPAPGRGEHQR